jgi:hypothetical protein
MRGMLEHVYWARKEPSETKRHIVDHGFTIINNKGKRTEAKGTDPRGHSGQEAKADRKQGGD